MGMQKIGLLSIVLIIALGFCGVGYAQWNHTLQAQGTVEVDDCWVEFDSYQSNDSGEAKDPGYTKHVASTEVEIKRGYKRCWCWCFSRQNTLVVTVENAYPSYQPTVDFWIKAYSRYHPAQLVCMKINGTPVAAGEEFPLYDDESRVVLVVTVNPPQTIGPCHCEKGDITIHVEQDADECHTYKFTVTMYYSFW